MSEPKQITDTLTRIARASTSARTLAREAVARHRAWRSNAEKQGLPVVNVTTGSGAPVLNRDVVLSHEHHDRRIGRK